MSDFIVINHFAEVEYAYVQEEKRMFIMRLSVCFIFLIMSIWWNTGWLLLPRRNLCTLCVRHSHTTVLLIKYKCMQHSPLEASSSSASWEIPHSLWNPRVHYSVHKVLPFVPVLSQIKSTCILIISFKNHWLMLSSYLHPVAYPGIFFFLGGCSTNSAEDRERREWGSGDSSPLVRGFTQFVNEQNPCSD
jgi:hypothetical protein